MAIKEMKKDYIYLYEEVHGHQPSAERIKAVDAMTDDEFYDECNRLEITLWAMRTQGE